MATAGERYEDRTGNIWSYAHRGDLSGLRAALTRGVCPNKVNTVGWTPAHAAAAGGHVKALRMLAKSDADLEIADRGGNLPAHQAAKNGHVHVLRVLKELGADITRVRLSQAKGKAARNMLIEEYRRVGKKSNGEEEAEDAPVGYARKQAKSTAFWGPRRTPISTKIKKKIIKEKRLKNKEKKEDSCNEVIEPGIAPSRDANIYVDDAFGTVSAELSYVETVRQVKRNKKYRQLQKQGRKHQSQNILEEHITSSEEESMESFSSSDESEDEKHVKNGFAGLSLLDESDDSEDE